MRKRRPNDVIDQFQSELESARHDRDALTPAGTARPLAQRVTMDAFARAGVAFERFRSDWHIAAISRDATAFNKSQVDRVKAALVETGDKRALLAEHVKELSLKPHPTLAAIEEILDAEGANLSVPDYATWKELAEKHLVDPWQSKVVSIPVTDQVIIDVVIKLRNAAAHQSTKSTDAMNDALVRLRSKNRALARLQHRVTPTGIPAYLHGAVPGGQPRIEIYIDALTRISEGFRN